MIAPSMIGDWTIVRHRVSVAGRVTDGYTGRPIGGALVQLAREDGFSQSTSSAPDGLFSFLELKAGEYLVAVMLPSMGGRYAKTFRELAIADFPEDSKFSFSSLPFLTIPLQPWVIRGKVSEKGQNGISMAEVVVKGSGEKCFSKANGEYEIVAVEPPKPGGSRTVQVFAKGYKAEPQRVEIDTDTKSFKPLNFELERPNGKPAGKGKVRE